MIKYKTIPGMVITQICGSYFLVTTKETIAINETAYICLRCLKQGSDINELCSAIEEQYDIADHENLLLDVHNLIADLLSRKLIMRYNH